MIQARSITDPRSNFNKNFIRTGNSINNNQSSYLSKNNNINGSNLNYQWNVKNFSSRVNNGDNRNRQQNFFNDNYINRLIEIRTGTLITIIMIIIGKNLSERNLNSSSS